MAYLTAKVDDELKAAVVALSKKYHISISAVVRIALYSFFEELDEDWKALFSEEV